MPLIQIWNWRPFERGSILHDTLKTACCQVEELELTEKDISVCYGGEDPFHGQDNDDPLVIIVELLFYKPGRTPEARQKLAEFLGQTAKQVCKGRTVEVALRPFKVGPADNTFWVG
jgi:hypothetical protein